jgi:hypothetical protein
MVADLYGGVDSLPTSFIIDRQGKIAGVHVGLVSKSVYENEILQLLDNKTTDTKGGVAADGGSGSPGGAK